MPGALGTARGLSGPASTGNRRRAAVAGEGDRQRVKRDAEDVGADVCAAAPVSAGCSSSLFSPVQLSVGASCSESGRSSPPEPQI